MNHFEGARWPTRVEVRVGRSPDARPWGVGVERRGAASWRSWKVDAAMEMWRQPPVADRTQPIDPDLQFGVELRGRAERPFLPVWFSARRASLVIDIAVKTDGFVPGQPLGAGVSLRAGLMVPFP